jgi:hypothetical protein
MSFACCSPVYISELWFPTMKSGFGGQRGIEDIYDIDGTRMSRDGASQYVPASKVVLMPNINETCSRDTIYWIIVSY